MGLLRSRHLQAKSEPIFHFELPGLLEKHGLLPDEAFENIGRSRHMRWED
jgi:hypothetical protein